MLINGGLGFRGWGLGLGFWGWGFQLMGFGAWGVELSGFYGVEALYNLQELKLQGIKIRDGVVFSQYSRAQVILAMCTSGCVAQLVDHWICNQEVLGSMPTLGTHLTS